MVQDDDQCRQAAKRVQLKKANLPIRSVDGIRHCSLLMLERVGWEGIFIMIQRPNDTLKSRDERVNSAAPSTADKDPTSPTCILDGSIGHHALEPAGRRSKELLSLRPRFIDGFSIQMYEHHDTRMLRTKARQMITQRGSLP